MLNDEWRLTDRFSFEEIKNLKSKFCSEVPQASERETFEQDLLK